MPASITTPPSPETSRLPETDPPRDARQAAPVLNAAIRKALGVQLAVRLDSVRDQELPDRLRDLVQRLTAALTGRDGPVEEFHQGLLAALPHLRAFAISLSGSHHRADDLVQETMLKALRNIDKFERGTNLQGWLFTILRNQFHTEYRKRHREVADPDGIHAGRLGVAPEQEAHADHEDLLAALAQLPVEQREVLILVGAQGISYEEAASVCAVPIGTIKSRMNRARLRLAALLSVEPGDYGADRLAMAAIARAPEP